MTLASILELVPMAEQSKALVYRVKPPDVYVSGKLMYTRKRYVVIQQDGTATCTCLLGRHLGIPCQHFFAVLMKFTQHGFNIRQVNLHWHQPERINLSLKVEWIHHRTFAPIPIFPQVHLLPPVEPSVHLQISLHTSQVHHAPIPQINSAGSPMQHPSTPRHSTMPPTYQTPTPNGRGKRDYQDLTSEAQTFAKTNQSPERFRRVCELIQRENKQIKEEALLVEKGAAVSMRKKAKHSNTPMPSSSAGTDIPPLDPINMYRTTGRKAEARKKAAHEPRKPRKLAKSTKKN
jgi:hypothetical protein